MSDQSPAIDALLHESRTFPPPEDFARQANLSDPAIYERAANDPEGFWEEQAKELHWFKPWDTVLKWDPPYAEWFVGGKLNVSYNCLDRHLSTPRKNKAALIWEGEPGDRKRAPGDPLGHSLRTPWAPRGRRFPLDSPLAPPEASKHSNSAAD